MKSVLGVQEIHRFANDSDPCHQRMLVLHHLGTCRTLSSPLCTIMETISTETVFALSACPRHTRPLFVIYTTCTSVRSRKFRAQDLEVARETVCGLHQTILHSVSVGSAGKSTLSIRHRYSGACGSVLPIRTTGSCGSPSKKTLACFITRTYHTNLQPKPRGALSLASHHRPCHTDRSANL